MRRMLPLVLVILFLMTGCGGETVEQYTYLQISQEEARHMMDEQEGAVVLDVREIDEYESGHIPGAVLLPVGTISEQSAAEAIPAKDTPVFVYCRSGNRSRTAADKLVQLGYSKVYEFGGINTWPYEIEK